MHFFPGYPISTIHQSVLELGPSYPRRTITKVKENRMTFGHRRTLLPRTRNRHASSGRPSHEVGDRKSGWIMDRPSTVSLNPPLLPGPVQPGLRVILCVRRAWVAPVFITHSPPGQLSIVKTMEHQRISAMIYDEALQWQHHIFSLATCRGSVF
ncbi:hypothetical protein LZ30DRAFT_705765 [Colletotrichum cereale]|nr:hypothetical protein LZ30DRAFT_705765 [Colletotrichum cereale]